MKNYYPRPLFAVLFSVLLLTSMFVGSTLAQTEAEAQEAVLKGAALLKMGKFVDAVPFLAIAAKGMPNDQDVRSAYGIALLGASKQTDNVEDAKKFSASALVEFQAAKKLGLNDPQVDYFIKLLSGDGSAVSISNPRKPSPGEQFMQQAETLFAQSKYDEAVLMYQKALDADPKLYEAALYMGDAYVSKQDWTNAEKAYQKAIAIDPIRETAYRYSATPFMKQSKYDIARDRYIEAYITEPYSEMAPSGIGQWATATGATLGHPKMDVPNGVDISDPRAAYLKARSDAEKAGATASHPYRRNLQDEARSIRAMLTAAKGMKAVDPQIQTLQKLDSEGLLESFILLAIADEGVAQDHPAYLKDNRAKLRQYVLNYVIHK